MRKLEVLEKVSTGLNGLMVVVMVVYLGVAGYAFYEKINGRGDTEKLSDAKSQFYVLADKILQGNDASKLDRDGLQIAFNSIDRTSDRVLSTYGFANVLEDYAASIHSDKNQENNKFFSQLKEAIKTERRAEPYSQIPKEQGRLLKNLDDAIVSDQKDSAEFNLKELNSILVINDEHVKDLESQNAWSIPLAIVGLILTLVFGIAGIARPFRYSKVKTDDTDDTM